MVLEYLRFLSLDLRKISLPHRLEIIRSDYEFFFGKIFTFDAWIGRLRYFESIGNISFDGFKYFFFLNFSNFIGVTYISMDFPIGLVSFKFEGNMTESRKWNSRKITQ